MFVGIVFDWQVSIRPEHLPQSDWSLISSKGMKVLEPKLKKYISWKETVQVDWFVLLGCTLSETHLTRGRDLSPQLDLLSS